MKGELLMTVLIVILIFFAVLTGLLLIPSELMFSFVWNECERRTELKFKYLFLKIILMPKEEKKGKKKKKEKKENDNNKEKKKYTFDDVKEKCTNIKDIYFEIKDDAANILAYVGKHAVSIKNLDINVRFDFDDPMKTGIYTGIINGSVYNVIGLIDRAVSVEKMKVNIIPLFNNRNFFDISVNGIVKIKNVHIMFILIKTLKIMFKLKKIKK